MRTRTSAAVAVLFVIGSGTMMQAQSVQGTIGVTGGSATDVAGITSRALTVTPSLMLSPDPRAVFALSANGTRFENQQWSAMGSVGTALRAPLGSHAAATVNASAMATTTSYDFSYRTAGVLPALELTAGPVTAYGGARIAAGSATSRVQQIQPGRGGFGVPSVGQSLQSASRSSLGEMVGANARFMSSGQTLMIGARVEQAHIDSIAQLDRTVTLSSSSGSVSFNGALGLRTEPGTRTVFGSVGGAYSVTRNASIEVDAGAYPADRLIGTPAGRFLSIGASLHVGHASPPRMQPPRVEGTPAIPAGMTRLTINAENATRVDVIGDFTSWQPIAAHRAPNGVWYLDLRIPPGQYRYAFRANGATWLVPTGVEVVDDDFGGKAAWLVVSTPESTARRPHVAREHVQWEEG